MLQGWWHYFFRTVTNPGLPSQVRISLDSLRPLGRSSSGGGWGVDDTEWPDEAVPAVASTSGSRRQISAVRNGDGRPRV